MKIQMTPLIFKETILINLIYGCEVLPWRINLNYLKKGSFGLDCLLPVVVYCGELIPNMNISVITKTKSKILLL